MMGIKRPEVSEWVEWAKQTPFRYPYSPTPEGPAEVLEVRGRNVLVDKFGATDWLYLPDLAWLKVVDKPDYADQNKT